MTAEGKLVSKQIIEIFTASINLMIQKPNLLIHSLVLATITIINNLIPYENSVNYICLTFMLGFAQIYGYQILSNYYILYIYSITSTLRVEEDIFLRARRFFIKTLLQTIIGIIVYGVSSLIVLFFVYIFSKIITSLTYFFVFVGLYITGLLFFGVISLGQRILLETDEGILKSIFNGLRDLSLHKSWYLRFNFIYFICSAVIFWGQGLLGSLLTGVNIFSVSIFPIFSFFENYRQATSHWMVQLLGYIISVFSVPFFSFLITYAYLSRKNIQTTDDPLETVNQKIL